ncbi:MAG: hypothetical protein IJ979_02945, partial [Tidjanibacter sp.]|nr:hypothetical protein [Tidjanibacter sp.]
MKKNIEKSIYSTFEELTTMYWSNNNDTSIAFPFYADKQTIRVSEQELRICLIKNLLQNECSRISVETPTRRNYRFKGGVRVGDDCGQERSESARIDLTLLDKTKKKC